MAYFIQTLLLTEAVLRHMSIFDCNCYESEKIFMAPERDTKNLLEA